MKEKKSNKIYHILTFLMMVTIFVITSPVVNAESYNYDVPYLRQLDYTDIGESACGPTSIAMILQYYFPNSGIDMPDVYHAGLQGYSYQGPATGYKDVSFQTPNIGLDIVDEKFRTFYTGDYSGLRSSEHAADYLDRVWGGNSYGGDASFQDVINEI